MPLAVVLATCEALTVDGVTTVSETAGAAVSFWTVLVACAVAPEMVAVTVKVIVPSLRLLASIVALHVLIAPTVVVTALVTWAPFLATTKILAPASPEPPIVTAC